MKRSIDFDERVISRGNVNRRVIAGGNIFRSIVKGFQWFGKKVGAPVAKFMGTKVLPVLTPLVTKAAKAGLKGLATIGKVAIKPYDPTGLSGPLIDIAESEASQRLEKGLTRGSKYLQKEAAKLPGGRLRRMKTTKKSGLLRYGIAGTGVVVSPKKRRKRLTSKQVMKKVSNYLMSL